MKFLCSTLLSFISYFYESIPKMTVIGTDKIFRSRYLKISKKKERLMYTALYCICHSTRITINISLSEYHYHKEYFEILKN